MGRVQCPPTPPTPRRHCAAEAHTPPRTPVCVTLEVQEEELRERKKGDIDKRYKPTKMHWISGERQTGQERGKSSPTERRDTGRRLKSKEKENRDVHPASCGWSSRNQKECGQVYRGN